MRTLIFAIASLALRAADPAFFIQISDPQLGMYAKNANSDQEQANLRFVVANINRLKPAFVVVCGDLVNRAGDLEQITSYKEIVKMIDPNIPVYNVAGNHDVGNQPNAGQLARYRKEFGRDYYTFDAAGVRGIVLNSSLMAAPENVPDEGAAQEKWLLQELERARRDQVGHLLVFQHISYFLRDPDEPNQYFNIPGAIRQRYLQWYHDHGVTHIFAGHYHRNSYGRDGEIEMVTTGPVGLPLGRDQSGIRIVRVTKNAIENRYYELGSIPHTIDPRRPLPEWPALPKEAP